MEGRKDRKTEGGREKEKEGRDMREKEKEEGGGRERKKEEKEEDGWRGGDRRGERTLKLSVRLGCNFQYSSPLSGDPFSAMNLKPQLLKFQSFQIMSPLGNRVFKYLWGPF